MKPIIGMNVDIQQGTSSNAKIPIAYLEAIQQAGGIPLLLVPMPDEDLHHLLDSIHGMLFIGGDDYCPTQYGEQVNPCVELIDPVRQDFDLRLMKSTLSRPELPVLGICGGCQLLNISLGGSLIQDINTAIPHTKVQHRKPEGYDGPIFQHPVSISSQSKIRDIYRLASFSVPTSHHQAVKSLGKGLKASAHAEDGVIEAVEAPDRPFTIGVQWHPERDFENHQPLFEAFVSQAANNLKREFCEHKS